MPAERTTMRQVREVLRLKFVGGVPIREIARRIGVAASTVRTTMRRLQVAGLLDDLFARFWWFRCQSPRQLFLARHHVLSYSRCGQGRSRYWRKLWTTWYQWDA